MYFKLNTIKVVLKALTPKENETIRPYFGKLLDVYSKLVFSGKLAHFLYPHIYLDTLQVCIKWKSPPSFCHRSKDDAATANFCREISTAIKKSGDSVWSLPDGGVLEAGGVGSVAGRKRSQKGSEIGVVKAVTRVICRI
ncbi:unnamed protein product [Arabidopsis lyrata]|nr:unnamed protein product [Arabidopsis lyrata]